MGSRVSSEPTAVVKLPIVGTSWYRRGVGYWLRRVVWSGTALLTMVLMFGLLLGAFGSTVDGLSGVWPLVLWIAMCAACVGAAIWGWIYARRQMRAKHAEPSSPEEAWKRHKESGQQVGSALSSPWRAMVLLAPFMAPLFAWMIGLLCASVFIRELPAEARARRAMASRT
ncbi:hypothetical protein ACGFRG_35475 [Streptomyces sp. NPDC048696]|uniref:hypothetical protein n=1 Tax=Streptomyces sp. NPDC048696 TaxID=3365585 RepID=UPI0037220EEB